MSQPEEPWRAARGAVQFPPGTPPSEELIRQARGDTPATPALADLIEAKFAELEERGLTIPEPESFHAIRRADLRPIGMDDWLTCGGPGDWRPVEEYGLDHASTGPVEYEICLMTVTPVARRTFGQPDEDDEDVP